MPAASSSSRSCTAQLGHLLDAQLKDLEAHVSSATAASLSSCMASKELEHLLTAQLKDLEVVVEGASSSCVTLPLLTAPTPPLSSPPSSASSSGNEEAFYLAAAASTTTSTFPHEPFPPRRNALHAHLSQVQQLLVDSDFELQQRVFTLWKQKAWVAMRLRVRLRVALDALKHLHWRARETHAQLARADLYAVAYAGRKAVRRLAHCVAARAHRMALVAHGQRVVLENRGRYALARWMRRLLCRKRGELVALQQEKRLLASCLQGWWSTRVCRVHLRRRDQRQVAQSFTHWRHAVRAEKHYLMELTVALRARKALFAMVHAYRYFVSRSDDALYLMSVRRLKVALARWWLEGCQRRRTDRLVESLASSYHYQTLVRKGVGGLLTHAQQQREAARATQAAEGLHATHLLTRTLREWRHAARVQALEMEALAQQRAAAWKQHQKVVAFRQLREHVERQGKAKAFGSARLVKTAQRRLGEWMERTQQRSSSHAKLEQHRGHRRHKVLPLCLQRWRRHCRLEEAARRIVRLRHARQAQVVVAALLHARRTFVAGRQVQAGAEEKVRRQCLRWWAVAAKHAQALRFLYMRRGLRLWRIARARQRLQRGIEEDLGGKAWQHARARRGLRTLRAWVIGRRQKGAEEAAIQVHREGVLKQRGRAALLAWKTTSKDSRFRWFLEQEAGAWAQRQQTARGLILLAQRRYRRNMEGMTLAMADQLWAHQRRNLGLAALQHMYWATVTLPAQQRSLTQTWRLQQAWGQWRKKHLRAAGNRARQADAMASVGQYSDARRLSKALGYLRRAGALVRQQALVRAQVRRGALTQAWQGWRRECMLEEKLRRFQRRQRYRLLTRVLHEWHTWSEAQPGRRALAAGEILKARRAKVFRAWRAVVLHRRDLQSKAAAVAKAAENGLLLRTLVGWTEALVDAWREQRAEQLYLGTHGLRPWRQWVRQTTRERAHVAQVLAKDARRVLRTAIQTWQEAWRLAGREEAAVRAMAQWRAARAWPRWNARVVQRRQDRLAQAHHRGRQLGYWRRYVARVHQRVAWEERVQAWGASRPTAVRVLVSLFPTGQKQLAWNQWLAFYGNRLQDRDGRECGDVHHARRVASACLRRLSVQAQTRQYERIRESFNQGLAVFLTKAKAFQALRARVCELRGARLAEKRRQVEARLARERRQLLKQTFLRWAAYTTTMHMARDWLHSTKSGRDASRPALPPSSSSSPSSSSPTPPSLTLSAAPN